MKDKTKEKLKKFEEKNGISFNNPKLLKEALTHRSYINELSHKERGKEKNNERLEFFGDAVLELIVTEFLFNKFPEKLEGELTSLRAALVNTNSIKLAGQKLGIDEFMFMSEGEVKDVGRAREKILADAFEALIGALYLDKGYNASKAFISKNLLIYLDEVIEKRLWQDSKSQFQELSQEKVTTTPVFKLISEEGPDHRKTFEMGVYLEDEEIAKGKGVSKQEAQQEAARKAIKKKGWN